MERRAYVIYKTKNMHFFRDIAKKGFLNGKNVTPKCTQSGIQGVGAEIPPSGEYEKLGISNETA